MQAEARRTRRMRGQGSKMKTTRLVLRGRPKESDTTGGLRPSPRPQVSQGPGLRTALSTVDGGART
eukprot:8395951-Heterocapsa_arctica.AAC.1